MNNFPGRKLISFYATRKQKEFLLKTYNKFLTTNRSKVKYPKNLVLHDVGDFDRNFYIVKKGSVDIYYKYDNKDTNTTLLLSNQKTLPLWSLHLLQKVN